jgi:hypothetical protein
MTAAQLLAELTTQGFCLEACEDGIAVVPASQLTETQVQAIRRHKAELLVLLRVGSPPTAEEAPRNNRQEKAQKSVAAPKAAIVPSGDGGPPLCKPGPAPEAIPERTRPKPPLCSTCWQLGYPNCTPCSLAYDSSLALGPDGVLYRVRLQTEEDRLDWRRCEVCHDPFQAPRFGSPNVCPECRNRIHRSR